MRPAARLDDDHDCPLINKSGQPHVGHEILPPCASTVSINSKPVARVTDKARCDAPAPDTIRGGLLSFFVEGNPVSRQFDDTDQGMIMEGSPDVMLGERVPGPLTPEQAQWLYDYMASLKNEIPFRYANDGCFARAQRMADHMESLDIPVQKSFVHIESGQNDLQPTMVDYPGHPVAWWYHVAPAVSVTNAATQSSQLMVIDPSLDFGGPVDIPKWINAQNPASPYIASLESSDVYVVGLNGEGKIMKDQNELIDNFSLGIGTYREDRDAMLRICSPAVHF